MTCGFAWRKPSLLVIASVGSAVLAATAVQAQVLPLAAHRAIYDLTLAQSHKASLQSVRGRILYDFSGSACAGYTTKVRQVTEMDNGEGTLNISDLRSTTWEDDAGKTFRFNSANYVNDKLATVVDGTARRGAAGVEVKLRKPKVKTFRLDAATVFPTAQLRAVIVAAHAGKTFLPLPVFDGSENGDKVYDTLSVIGPVIAPTTKTDDAARGKPELAKVPRWHVRVSYFDRKGRGDEIPSYAIAFELYENGISRALTLDYNDFTVSGTMTKLDLKKPQACK